ncbi:FIG00638667: hypothetical protein [hydrothermal vent metagenome]|uniref:Periplasmic protein YibQ, distant homology with nucleoside diphosphatase and polysaccharide deacetylase n=1 Tax=hydrothermal vent metagenome TaxID=652676 RepID=A0A1W1D5N3_9ZZZZ
MAKKNKKRKIKKTPKKTISTLKIFNYFIIITGIIAILASSLLLIYSYFYQDDTPKHTKTTIPTPPPPKKEIQQKEKPIQEKLKEVLQTPKPQYLSAKHEIDGTKTPPPPSHKLIKKNVSQKPQLAIIIDDVATKSQVKNIHTINYPVTMSFLPPSKQRPNSAYLASKESFYMVHLPLEALHFSSPEKITLKVTDSQQTILNRVQEIKKLFPRVRYINNHTGSKFTANERAMNKLIYALKKYNIYFIDSRTTSKTKVPKVMKNFGYEYIARDIFLDNKSDPAYIIKQLKKAVRIAKKYGHAIAIGHPHKTTIETLKHAQKYLKDLDMVQINQLR